jgi:hypothetical protein
LANLMPAEGPSGRLPRSGIFLVFHEEFFAA